MSDEKSWAVQWLMSRRSSDEQTAVLTMASELLDDIQDKHDERRKEITSAFERRLDQISLTDYSAGNKPADVQKALRDADRKSAQDAYDKALARLDVRSASIQDVQRIIVRR
ncbi:MAG: hypothetical protein ACOYB3_02165 [Azonexus sp.]